MSTDQPVDSEVLSLLQGGLRNYWYCIAASWEVGDKPVAVTRLGEKLVLWRDQTGKVHVQEDQCPHRAAALSFGSVVDGVLTCGYHGVQIDGEGRVVDVPAYRDCPFIGEKLVKTYPSFEHYQGIFAWFGDEAHQDPLPLEIPDDLATEERSGILHVNTWACNWNYVMENVADPMHAPYLHRTSFNLGKGARSDRIKIQDTPHGFEVFRDAQRDADFDWAQFVDTGSTFYQRVEVFYPPACGPGGPLKICFFTTPIDDRHTRIHVWRMRETTGWQRDLWQFLFKTQLVKFADGVLEQDRLGVETMPMWPPRENLYQHDIGVARLRRHFRTKAEAQVHERHNRPALQVAE